MIDPIPLPTPPNMSPKMKIKPINDKIAMCPAEMLPASLNINVNGLINNPMPSTAANNG